jgi:hypothetical protein
VWLALRDSLEDIRERAATGSGGGPQEGAPQEGGPQEGGPQEVGPEKGRPAA